MAFTFEFSKLVDKTLNVDSSYSIGFALAINIYHHDLLLTGEQLNAVEELLAFSFCSRELVLKLRFHLFLPLVFLSCSGTQNRIQIVDTCASSSFLKVPDELNLLHKLLLHFLFRVIEAV